MTSPHHHIAKSPGWYIRQRLLQNKPAMFGAGVVALAVVIALLGHLVMPDQTPNANDGAVQIQKMPPGFSMTFLRIRKNASVPQRGLVRKAIFGQESAYMIVPVKAYKIEGMRVVASVFGKANYTKEYSLPNVVLPLNIDEATTVKADIRKTKIDSTEIFQFHEVGGKQVSVTYRDLVRDFRKNNIRHRTYWLGTDRAGRDMLSRLLYGTRISLSIGFVAVLISMFLGLALGSLAGFFGGRTDAIIVWFMSVIWPIPGIMLVIAISMALQSRAVWVAFVAVGLTMWVDVARVIRGQVMAIKEKLYVEAARAFGINNFRIVYHHILPNILGPVIVLATANFASAILLEAGLGFLGLSVQPPTPSWGNMINEGFQAIGTKNSWHLVLFPGLAICIMVLSFNLFGNGLRDAYDPKTLLK